MIFRIPINLKKFLCYLCVFTVLFSANAYLSFINNNQQTTASPTSKFTVVLDAGHGGVDSGCVGKNTNAYERDINLSITKKIGNFLNVLGVGVVYTRTNEDGLYGTFASGHKMRDMRAREAIIKEANPNLVVSIHLNSFTAPSAKGAQVFYKLGSETSKDLADNMQSLFAEQIEGSKKTSTEGDFYILNCSNAAGVLVECGFLSNPDEEAKLVTDEYQERIAYIITCGIISFFGLNSV